MLSSFGVDISKNLEAKRKKLEGFTQASLKASKEKVGEMWQQQKMERFRCCTDDCGKETGVISFLFFIGIKT